MSSEFPYWVNLNAGSVVFSVTQSKVQYGDYAINQQFDENNLVQCKINQSKGTNASDMYPLNIKLTLEYYQQTPETKKMISCTVDYSLYM